MPTKPFARREVIALVAAVLLGGGAGLLQAAETNALGKSNTITISWREHGVDTPHAIGLTFLFPGGTPRQLLEAIDRHFHSDWLSVATIPPEMERVFIPKLRLALQPDALPEAAVVQSVLAGMVRLYDQMSRDNPRLGKLTVAPGEVLGCLEPALVLFSPDKGQPPAGLQFKARAFSLFNIPPGDWEALEKEIDLTRDIAVHFNLEAGGDSGAAVLKGTVSIHKETGVLVACGAEEYLQTVESIVTAFRGRGPRPPQPPK